MAEDSVSTGAKRKPARLSRGFVRAGGLIGPQMQRAATRRGFAQARLRALWPDIAGPELAAICVPVKLAPARGPAGGLLTLAVAGAHAPQLQMLLPLVRERVNAALGPRTVGRIQLTQGGFAETPRTYTPRPAPAAPPPDLGAMAGDLSSIGDGALRDALETLARNVLSRTRPRKRPE
jgi:hypothetical protein